jgi:cysteine sulfinate desulfinase/cysteine desulfurase-like protein
MGVCAPVSDTVAPRHTVSTPDASPDTTWRELPAVNTLRTAGRGEKEKRRGNVRSAAAQGARQARAHEAEGAQQRRQRQRRRRRRHWQLRLQFTAVVSRDLPGHLVVVVHGQRAEELVHVPQHAVVEEVRVAACCRPRIGDEWTLPDISERT